MTPSSADLRSGAVHPLLVAAVPGLGEAIAPPAQLSRDRTQLDPALVRESQRWRLLIAAARVIAAEGYGSTTIERITAGAGVSKKTFYKFFASKEEAFLACYEAIEPALDHVVLAADDQPGVEAKVGAMVSTYLSILGAAPALTRMFLVEALAASPGIRRQRAASIARFSRAIEGRLAAAHEVDPAVPVLSGPTVLAMVGGINELCVDHLARHGPETLPELHADICRFVLHLLGRPGDPARA